MEILQFLKLTTQPHKADSLLRSWWYPLWWWSKFSAFHATWRSITVFTV